MAEWFPADIIIRGMSVNGVWRMVLGDVISEDHVTLGRDLEGGAYWIYSVLIHFRKFPVSGGYLSGWKSKWAESYVLLLKELKLPSASGLSILLSHNLVTTSRTNGSAMIASMEEWLHNCAKFQILLPKIKVMSTMFEKYKDFLKRTSFNLGSDVSLPCNSMYFGIFCQSKAMFVFRHGILTQTHGPVTLLWSPTREFWKDSLIFCSKEDGSQAALWKTRILIPAGPPPTAMWEKSMPNKASNMQLKDPARPNIGFQMHSKSNEIYSSATPTIATRKKALKFIRHCNEGLYKYVRALLGLGALSGTTVWIYRGGTGWWTWQTWKQGEIPDCQSTKFW